jgi:hypothetical protein
MRRLRRILPMAFFILAVSAMPLMAGSKGDHGDDKKDGDHHEDYGYHDKDKKDDDHHKNYGVPEIDPRLAPTALALLSGGVLLLKSKSARK